MKEKGIIMSGDHPRKILDGTKTMTRRVVTPHTSIVGEGKVDWAKFCWDGSEVLSSRLQEIFASGYEKGSLAESVHKNDFKAPMPWVDNSYPDFKYLHVPYNWSEDGTIFRIYPKWDIGDRLWVREIYWYHIAYKRDKYPVAPMHPPLFYVADGLPDVRMDYYRKMPSIHMNRWMSRIPLEITELRAERLQDITVEDTKREGCAGRPLPNQLSYRNDEFKYFWDSLNAKRGYGWDRNPWVWVMSFNMITNIT